MKRNVLGLLTAMMVAVAFVAAQDQSTPQTPTRTPDQSTPSSMSGQDRTATPAQSKSTTITGCLTQGSGPTVFILDNARMDAQDKTEAGKSYMVVASASSVDLKGQLNHEVTVSGSSDGKTAPMSQAGAKVDEKTLPKLTARSVSSIADTCTAAG